MQRCVLCSRYLINHNYVEKYYPSNHQRIYILLSFQGSPMVIAMFGGMIGEGVMKRGKSGHQYSVQRGRDFQQRWAYYLESLRSRRYSKNRNL